ncbi:MAG: SPOR domain-containing protein [bacterium]|nr:SPOR domain-containing protein [bacterium]
MTTKTATTKRMWMLCLTSSDFRNMPYRLFLIALLLAPQPAWAAKEPQFNTRVSTPWNDPSQIRVEPARPAEKMASPTEPTAPANPKPPAQPSKKAPAAPLKAPKVKALSSKSAPLNPYWVQAGAFIQDANAYRLQAQLKDEGYPARVHVTQDLDRRVYHLVLIGDFEDKDKAQEVAKAYTKKRQEKSVVIHKGAIIRVFNPDAKLVTHEKIPRVYADPGEHSPTLLEIPENIYQPVENPEAKFIFQVGGLYKLEAANKLAKELKKRGYRPLVNKKKDINQLDWWYAVEIGFFYTKAEAEMAASAFFEKEHLQAEVPPIR